MKREKALKKIEKKKKDKPLLNEQSAMFYYISKTILNHILQENQ